MHIFGNMRLLLINDIIFIIIWNMDNMDFGLEPNIFKNAHWYVLEKCHRLGIGFLIANISCVLKVFLCINLFLFFITRSWSSIIVVETIPFPFQLVDHLGLPVFIFLSSAVDFLGFQHLLGCCPLSDVINRLAANPIWYCNII